MQKNHVHSTWMQHANFEDDALLQFLTLYIRLRFPQDANTHVNERGFFRVHSELILALKKVLSYRKLGTKTLLSIVFVLLYSILHKLGVLLGII